MLDWLELHKDKKVGLLQGYKEIVDWRYNTLYKLPCTKDNEDFLLMRWIDNGVLVDMVSTVHTPGRETIVRRRRKPRETSTNYRHISTVFGSD
jgi:hypothetical protein